MDDRLVALYVHSQHRTESIFLDRQFYSVFQGNISDRLKVRFFLLTYHQNISQMPLNVKELKGYSYVDEGSGQVLMLLHGLFGALSNWEAVVHRFSSKFRVVIPMLPIYTMPIKEAGLEGLRKYVEDFVEAMQLDNMIIMGNSLGGHVALLYALDNESKVSKLVLTGSSGLFENAMGGSYPRRGSYDYVKER